MRTWIVGTLMLGAGMVGCGATPVRDESEGASASASAASDEAALADFVPGMNPHVMPVRRVATAPAFEKTANVVTPPKGAKLVDYGGPVLSSVKVYSVYWGSNVALQAHLDSFYKAITQSAYFDWLKEYNTSTQSIGRGSFAGSFTIKPSSTSTSLSDTTIQKELAKQITAGTLPKQDANTVYMVHFPPGVSISLDGSSSCIEFCAYHNTFKSGSSDVVYGIIPDQGGDCAGGCGPSPVEDGTTDVASHELMESVTDPAVGLATGNNAPLAWYDTINGEIGDICAGTGDSATVAGFTVQVEWSNKRKACVSQ